ncbi:MAG: DsbA family oxidoreductase [Bacteroidota bacterium]|nr:MAG: DsbA family oxidoreductase [Bacteroidota bacterium]
MIIEIWSDIMCPFCYIGKRHYENALKQFAGKNNIELKWKSYLLDPETPLEFEKPLNVYEYLAERKGISLAQSIKMHEHVVAMAKQAGLDYQLDKLVIANMLKAHRVIQFAKKKGLADLIEENMFKAYFTEGKNLADDDVLVAIGIASGLTKEEVITALTDDLYAYEVDQDIQEARAIGLTGVPFFVFDRKYAISGAQPTEAFLNTLNKSCKEWLASNPQPGLQITSGESCSTKGCDN